MGINWPILTGRGSGAMQLYHATVPIKCMSLNLAVSYADLINSVVFQDDFLPWPTPARFQLHGHLWHATFGHVAFLSFLHFLFYKNNFSNFILQNNCHNSSFSNNFNSSNFHP